MTTNHSIVPTRSLQAAQRSALPRLGGWIAMLALGWLAPAQAENVLEAVTFQPVAGGQVDVIMQLASAPTDPKLFTTDSPPRIAVDFDNTRSAVVDRRAPSHDIAPASARCRTSEPVAVPATKATACAGSPAMSLTCVRN